MITNPLALFSGTVIFTTTQPTGDICSAGGKTFLWAIANSTGGSGAASLYGTALVQTSTGAIAQEELQDIFTDRVAANEPTVNPDTGDAFGRRSAAITGVSTADTPPAVIIPKPYRRIISVIER
jgi:hypothetical protein